jgi:hypothetical protein
MIIIVLAALAVGTFVLALTAEPNNWDSQAYHLPKGGAVGRHRIRGPISDAILLAGGSRPRW